MTNINENRAGLKPIVGEGIKCPQCEKRFANEHGVMVHISRTHSGHPRWATTGKLKSTEGVDPEVLKKRKYNKLYRQGYRMRNSKLMRAAMDARAEEREEQMVQPVVRALEAHSVNFCPKCGCNLAAVQIALSIKPEGK